jgi:uncharacterized membrane protein YphA (DoxX/SURF4 family)
MMNRFATRFAAVGAALALSSAAFAGTVNFDPGNANTSVASPTTFTDGTLNIVASAFILGTPNTSTSLFEKYTSGDPGETGLGIDDSDSDKEINTLNFIQLDISGLAGKASDLTLTIGSIQSGEGYILYGTNTAGATLGALTNGTQLKAYIGNGSNTQNTYDLGAAFNTYKYIDVTADGAGSAGSGLDGSDVLVDTGTITAVPVPASAWMGLTTLAGIALAAGFRRKMA